MVARVVRGVSITPDTEALPGSVQHTPHLVGAAGHPLDAYPDRHATQREAFKFLAAPGAARPVTGTPDPHREIDTSGVSSAGKPSGVDLARIAGCRGEQRDHPGRSWVKAFRES
jgi:hypothetical protein